MLAFVKALSTGLGLAVLVILIMWVCLYDSFRSLNSVAPTDQALEANFKANQQKLDTLVEISRVDKLVRLTNGQRAVSKEQDQKVRALVREIGLQGDILQETTPGSTTTMYLTSWSGGLMTNGARKGYVYSDTELTPVVASLDDVNSWPKGSKVIYKKLEGNWYLFFMGT
jgi:hypothetical protein